MEIRYIKWLDSNGGEGWTGMKRLRGYRPCVVHSVGFVISEDDSHVTILQSFDMKADMDNQNGDNFISIPKVCITKMRTLRKR